MLDTLITSKTRIKLLLKFFLNNNSVSYLRELESEFNESSNGIRLELNKLEKAGLLTSEFNGNKKLFKANPSHPLYNDIHNIVMKHTGLDAVIDKVISKIGELDIAILHGEFAKGKNGDIINLLLIGEEIDEQYLLKLIQKAEVVIQKKIKYIICSIQEKTTHLNKYNKDEILILWQR